MKKQFKNFGFLIAGIIIATLIFNPSFASQIRSNLVKGFVAITSDSSKAQNNLVGLDAGGKLPTDILPASAAGTSDSKSKFINILNIYEPDGYSASSCPSGYEQIGISSGNGNRSSRVHYDTMYRGTMNNNGNSGIMVHSMNIGHHGCRLNANERNYQNLTNKIFYSDAKSKRCSVITTCIKVY